MDNKAQEIKIKDTQAYKLWDGYRKSKGKVSVLVPELFAQHIIDHYEPIIDGKDKEIGELKAELGRWKHATYNAEDEISRLEEILKEYDRL